MKSLMANTKDDCTLLTPAKLFVLIHVAFSNIFNLIATSFEEFYSRNIPRGALAAC